MEGSTNVFLADYPRGNSLGLKPDFLLGKEAASAFRDGFGMGPSQNNVVQ